MASGARVSLPQIEARIFLLRGSNVLLGDPRTDGTGRERRRVASREIGFHPNLKTKGDAAPAKKLSSA
jgi:hypothetical protein